MNNALYLRRRSKICLPAATDDVQLPVHYLASLLKNIEGLGFTFSAPLIAACLKRTLAELTPFYKELVPMLREAVGAHQKFRPMYPNFPDQVMAMSAGELYFNAILHYVTEGRFLPPAEIKKRIPLLKNPNLRVIDLGTEAEFESLFGQIVGGNTSLSVQDKEDADWFIRTYGDAIWPLLPETIPQKENMATVAGLLLKYTNHAPGFLRQYTRTATDILRVAVSLSGGDVSLAEPTKFRSFSRAERGLLLALLDEKPNVVEDMLRWKSRWIRLGERLHPGEYAQKFPNAAEAFRILRNNVPVPTFNSHLEKALTEKRVLDALNALTTRPGDFARRLDHLLRLEPNAQDAVLTAFALATEKVATPLLLQVRQHFLARDTSVPLRVFFPKGNVAKAYAKEEYLPHLKTSVREEVVAACEEALIGRFGRLSSLGNVYVDPALQEYTVPFATRSASKAFRTLARGTRLPLPPDSKVLRFFLWWKNGTERTDIDLSASLFDADFQYQGVIAYYDLKNKFGCHSGDIVDAPEGASEFVDVRMDKALMNGIRYVVLSLTSYTQQPYCDLPECFAGWMAREKANSGEIYEPRTVQNRLDLTANTRIAIPVIIDLVERKALWCDMALRRNLVFENHVEGNLRGIHATLRAMTQRNKPQLYDLFRLHAQARGTVCETPDEADTVFSVESGIAFRQEEIASGYLA